MDFSSSVNIMVIIAFVLGVALVVDMVVFPFMEAWAKGCAPGSSGFNGSEGRCFKG